MTEILRQNSQISHDKKMLQRTIIYMLQTNKQKDTKPQQRYRKSPQRKDIKMT